MTQPVKVPRQHSDTCHKQALNKCPGFLLSLTFLSQRGNENQFLKYSYALILACSFHMVWGVVFSVVLC